MWLFGSPVETPIESTGEWRGLEFESGGRAGAGSPSKVALRVFAFLWKAGTIQKANMVLTVQRQGCLQESLCCLYCQFSIRSVSSLFCCWTRSSVFQSLIKSTFHSKYHLEDKCQVNTNFHSLNDPKWFSTGQFCGLSLPMTHPNPQEPQRSPWCPQTQQRKPSLEVSACQTTLDPHPPRSDPEALIVFSLDLQLS